MNKVGLVIGSKDGRVEVLITRNGACGSSCNGCSGCESKEHLVSLPNFIGAVEGDLVELESDSSSVLKHTAIMYVIPLLMFIISLGLSYSFFLTRNLENIELYSFLVGLLSLIMSYFILSLYDKKLRQNDVELVKISKIVRNNNI